MRWLEGTFIIFFKDKHLYSRSQNEGEAAMPPETNLKRILPVLCINFQLSSSLTTDWPLPNKILAALLPWLHVSDYFYTYSLFKPLYLINYYNDWIQ